MSKNANYFGIFTHKGFRMQVRYNGNSISVQRQQSLIMYVGMNSYFASCEQQLDPRYRNKAIGVCPYPGPNAVVIAASKEAKKAGVKTGMKVAEGKSICPDFTMVPVRPVANRRIHIKIMKILLRYCPDVLPRSIDEAVINLSHYTYIYKDIVALAHMSLTDLPGIARANECRLHFKKEKSTPCGVL